MGSKRQNLGFVWFYGTQTVRPPPKLRYKWHILGCHLAPEMIPIAQNCASLTNTPLLTVPILAVFGTWKTPCSEIEKFFTGVRMCKVIHVLCLKNHYNWCGISG